MSSLISCLIVLPGAEHTGPCREALQSALSLKRKAGAEPVQHATAKRPFLYDDDLSDDLSCSDDDGANEENGQSL